jgi:quercetin dioxygenase-like cupin family protein
VTHPTASPQQPGDALASTLKRTEIQHSPSSIPGREIVQVLTEIPVSVESGWHTHPGEEVGYIVAGTVEMAIAGQPILTLQSGDGFLIPPRTPHNARDIGPGTGRMLSTYIVEAGQPLASFIAEPDARLNARPARSPYRNSQLRNTNEPLVGKAPPDRASSPPRRNRHDTPCVNLRPRFARSFAWRARRRLHARQGRRGRRRSSSGR